MANNLFEAPRGMRDFYPEDMVLRERIFEAWRSTARLFGFASYDACVVESLALLQRKSGEEVSEQIYWFEDKSGRKLALRPEMTPTLARMIAARQGALAFPVKWTTIAQCFRYERMTRGRKREHYQWNLDVVGSDDCSAEIEVIAAAVSALRTMGLPKGSFEVRVNNRALLSELLASSGIAEAQHPAVFLALDKRGKIPDTEIEALLAAEGLEREAIEKTFKLLAVQTLEQAAALAGEDSPGLLRLRELFDLAELYGIADDLRFDIGVIRGLSYYTGIVFEAFDTAGKFRAIFGGGRYDNLLAAVGGKPMSAVGLGFGDVVVAEVLKDLLGETCMARKKGVVVGYMFPEQRTAAVKVARRLREEGRPVELMLSKAKPKQFFSRAAESGAEDALFIGPDDVAAGRAKLKHLEDRSESEITL